MTYKLKTRQTPQLAVRRKFAAHNTNTKISNLFYPDSKNPPRTPPYPKRAKSQQFSASDLMLEKSKKIAQLTQQKENKAAVLSTIVPSLFIKVCLKRFP